MANTSSPFSLLNLLGRPSLDRLTTGLLRLALATTAVLSLHLPVQAQTQIQTQMQTAVPPVNAGLREALGVIPIPGLKEATASLLGSLKPIDGTPGYAAKAVISGTPVILWVFGDASRQSVILAVKGNVTPPPIFANPVWKRLSGSSMSDPIFSLSLMEQSFKVKDMPPELKDIMSQSYFGLESLDIKTGFQFTARTRVGGVMKTVMDSWAGPTDYVLKVGVSIPVSKDPGAIAAVGIGLAMEMKKFASNVGNLPDFYIEVMTPPGVVLRPPFGSTSLSFSDVIMSMNYKGTLSATGNLIIPSGKKYFGSMEIPTNPSGAMDFSESKLFFAAQSVNMADMANVLLFLRTPQVPGLNVFQPVASFEGKVRDSFKILAPIEVRNLYTVPEYRQGGDMPSPRTANLMAIGPLGTFEDSSGKKFMGPFLRMSGNARVFGVDLGNSEFTVGPTGLSSAGKSTVSLKLGPLGRQTVVMESRTEVSLNEQSISFTGTMPGRTLAIKITPTRVRVTSPATCELPFEIDINSSVVDNLDIPALLDREPGVNVDPTKLKNCAGPALQDALLWISRSGGRNLGGYSPQEAGAKAKRLYDAEKDQAREVAEKAVSDAQKALKAAGNYIMTALGIKKTSKPKDPMADVIYSGSVFDWDYFYDDHLTWARNGRDLTVYWREKGFEEGLQGSLEFHAPFYIANNPDFDLKRWDLRGAVKHWLDHGMDRGRQGSKNFSIQAYVARYPQVFGWKSKQLAALREELDRTTSAMQALRQKVDQQSGTPNFKDMMDRTELFELSAKVGRLDNQVVEARKDLYSKAFDHWFDKGKDDGWSGAP